VSIVTRGENQIQSNGFTRHDVHAGPHGQGKRYGKKTRAHRNKHDGRCVSCSDSRTESRT
jgi:hypothetical protein